MKNLSRAVLAFYLCFLIGLLVANFVFAIEKIDINTAPLEELVKIIHIGEVRALELISLRPFSSLDDLARIKGIGEKRIEDIKKQGLAWVAPREEPKLEPEPELLPQVEPKPIKEPHPEAEDYNPPATLPKGPSKPITYPAGIVINEILPSPEGPDAEEEWIELFNQNNFEVELSNWQIADAAGKTTIFTFPAGTKISAQGFLVLSRPTTKITLNNDGDGVNLLQPNGNIIDTVRYGKAPRDQSYNRAESGWTWGSTLTPGSTNIIAAPILEAKEAKNSKESTSEKEASELKSKKELAAIAEQIPKEISPPFFILLIASAIAIFSGIIILILKKRAKNLDLSKKLE